MEKFIQHVKTFGTLSENGEAILRTRLKIRNLSKDDYFLETGEVSKEIGFITDGIMRVFYCDRKGDEFTRFFLKEGHFAVNLYSFNDGMVSSEYIQALDTTRLVMMSKQDMEYFYEKIPEWTGLIKKITEKALLEKMKVKTKMLETDATERYLYFLENYPEVIQRVSLGHIASFLGVTQSSLSRIRKSLSKNAFLPNDKNVPV